MSTNRRLLDLESVERTTFHVERRWIKTIRRQADLDGLTDAPALD